MSDWTPEELARISDERLRRVRLCQARQGARSTSETRIALVAFERGISDRELERFYFVNRKGAKKRHFDHPAFAKKYDIDIHWIWDGDLCGHPRGLIPPAKPQPHTPPSPEETEKLVALYNQMGPVDKLYISNKLRALVEGQRG